MTAAVSEILIFLIDQIFPSRCVHCRRPISFIHDGLCDGCREVIKPLRDGCPVCSGMLVEGQCPMCTGRKIYFEKNISLTEYEGVAREVLHHLKFSRRKRLYRHICRMSLPRLDECRESFDIVTCVPMKRSKRIRRGFNQSELVARDLSRKLGKPFRRLLREKGMSRAQRDLSYRERFINILDRYGVRDPGNVMGRRVLLVDDVFTTGATVNECARILRNAGAKEVYSLTFARAGIKKASGRLQEPVSPV